MRSAVATLLVALATTSTGHANTLQLSDVLDSVRSNHPLLAAAGTSLERAEAQRLAADGAFDPRVQVEATNIVSGRYQSTTVDSEVRVLTPVFGVTPFVGWQLGRGEFAEYDEKLRTLEGGELRLGASMPLLQGFGIDRPRADRSKAAISRRVATAEVGQRLLDVMRDASFAYWEWVAAGHRIDVRRTQLALALERGRQIDQAVARGNRAPIEALDNARLIAAREALVVNAERDLRRASLELSLHLRGSDGVTIVPDLHQRPPLPEEPRALPLELDLDAAVSRGLQQAPRLKELDARSEIADVDVALARNQTVGSSRVDLQACKLEYSIVSPK